MKVLANALHSEQEATEVQNALEKGQHKQLVADVNVGPHKAEHLQLVAFNRYVDGESLYAMLHGYDDKVSPTKLLGAEEHNDKDVFDYFGNILTMLLLTN